jgi:3'-phosphoadenosine 5'-phosphosulfate (PAPS) 3'-phosphatase
MYRNCGANGAREATSGKESTMNSSPVTPGTPLAAELGVAIRASSAAAIVINRFYDAHTAATYTKGDGSPVTDADIAADATIREVISAAFPEDGFITEEGENDELRHARQRVWIVDPIDGTAEYVAGTGRFDVLIALAIDGKPAVGVTLQPTTGLMHAAIAGQGAWRYHGTSWDRYTLSPSQTPPRIVASKYFLLPEQKDAVASVAQELGAAPPQVMDVGFQPRALDDAERWYDIFVGMPQDPRRFAAREWDIAASDIVVHEAGGVVTDAWGRPHRYNKQDSHIVGGLVASATPEIHERVIAALSSHLSPIPPDPDPADPTN